MISKVADILNAFRAAEATVLAKSNVKHPTLIGNMYEGLTQDILERAIPPGLGLQVVGGIVEDGMGGQSGQIDCMLVQGTGKPIPHVPNQYQWHVKDVIAVFEVKKNLYTGDLTDAYGHLDTVLQQYSTWIQKQTGPSTINLKPTFRAYSQATGKIAPQSAAWKSMPMDDHLIFSTIMADQVAPVRIIFGFEGYGTEGGLRRGLIDYLKQNQGSQGFGPYHLPNLIVAKGGSIVKLSGHPYNAPRQSNGRWPILASSQANPIRLMLELIWTRVSYQFPISHWFGEDLEVEELSRLLDAEPAYDENLPSKWGWKYYFTNLKPAELRSAPVSTPWTPVELDDAQYVVVNQLCVRDIPADEPEFLAFLLEEGEKPAEFISKLIATRLVALDGNLLTLTTDKCVAAILPDGRNVAADDNTGRMTRWLDKFNRAWRASKGL